MSTDETRTDDAATEADADALIGMEKRRRRAFTISLAVVALVVAVALGYSFFRDPGPQPTVPPKITGTDDGALKRAIVHYVGALESKDPAEIVRLAGTGVFRPDVVEAEAKASVEEFGEAAQQPTTAVVVAHPNLDSIKDVTVRFEDGSTQKVTFSGSSGSWYSLPASGRTPVAVPTDRR